MSTKNKHMRSELAIKRDEWFDSNEGKSCMEIDKLALHSSHRKYLKNRLEAAFLAGAKADAEVQQEICDKIASMVTGD